MPWYTCKCVLHYLFKSVYCYIDNSPGDVGFYQIVVQSPNNMTHLLESINDYVNYTTAFLNEVSDTEFMSQVNQTIEVLQKPRYFFVNVLLVFLQN